MRTVATICMILAAGPQLQAQLTPGINRLETRLKAVPIPEMPLLAALLVNQAKPGDRPATTTNVVKAAVRVAPAASLAVIGEMARARPEIAPIAACVLAIEQPTLTPDICRASVGAAPAYTRDILVSLCIAAPSEFHSLAVAAAEGAPSSGRAILRAVAAVRPELKPHLDLEMTNVGSTPASVSRCLERAERAQKREALQADAGIEEAGTPRPEAKPSAKPPDQTQHKPPRGGWGPPGGRNYAKP